MLMYELKKLDVKLWAVFIWMKTASRFWMLWIWLSTSWLYKVGNFLTSSSYRWEDSTKLVLKKQYEGVWWIQLTEDGLERWARVKVVMDLWASQKVWSFLTSWRLGVVDNKAGRVCVSWDWIRQALEGASGELLFRVPWNVRITIAWPILEAYCGRC